MLRDTAALVIFVLVYIIVLAGESSPRKLDRPAAGLIGAVLIILCGVMSKQEAIAAIDFSTLALLFGMMTVVHYASVSGLLEAFAEKLVGMSHSAIQLFWIVCLSAGFLSALFVNDTICLLMTPLLLAITKRVGLPAEPFLLCLATSSNVGSVMTITGNPQNMLIGQSSGWTWLQFALRMVPIGLVCLGLNGGIVHFIYRRQLNAASTLSLSSQEGRQIDKKLATKTLIVLGCLLLALLSGVSTDLAAMTAAVVMLVWANRPPEETFASIDWALLLFFTGLFIVIGGLTKTQSHLMAQTIPIFTQHTGSAEGLSIFSVGSVVGSNLFGNVPFVMLLRNWITQAPHAALLWLTLAMSSTFAGNLTLVGSVANLIVAQGAQKECPLSFWTFLKVGSVSTILTVAVGTLMLWIYHIAGWL
ncbi:MAG: SLC13 family permease [Ktedonobacteraceae bacterium]